MPHRVQQIEMAILSLLSRRQVPEQSVPAICHLFNTDIAVGFGAAGTDTFAPGRGDSTPGKGSRRTS